MPSPHGPGQGQDARLMPGWVGSRVKSLMASTSGLAGPWLAVAEVAALGLGVAVLLVGRVPQPSWPGVSPDTTTVRNSGLAQEGAEGFLVYMAEDCSQIEALDMATGTRYELVKDRRCIYSFAVTHDARLVAYSRDASDPWPSAIGVPVEAVLTEVGIGSTRVVAGRWPGIGVEFSPDERYLEVNGYPQMSPSTTVAHYSVDLETGAEELLPPGVLSPDWTMTFTPSGGGLTLWRVGSWERSYIPLGGKLQAGLAAWSPDSSMLAVPMIRHPYDICGLVLIALGTGQPRTLFDSCDGEGETFIPGFMAWSPDGRWIALREPADISLGAPYRYHAGLFLVEVQSGALSLLVPRVTCCPLWSPDSRQIAFVSQYLSEPFTPYRRLYNLYIVTVPSGEITALGQVGSALPDTRWIPELAIKGPER